MRYSIVPPYLLRQLITIEDPALARVVEAATVSLSLDGSFRSVRGERRPLPRSGARARPLGPPDRRISDADNTENLPGSLVRSEGEDPTADVAVTEAYDGFGHTHALFAEVFGRAGIDDDNLPLNGTVHFGSAYDNAFWDGERMVFGDGDGMVFTRFTASLSVIGHELAHGVTQYSANLIYKGQSGALNESMSDVFGALVEQRALGQFVGDASWLIGEGLFTDRVRGRALRSMKAPGTAYADDALGTDPQPDSMDGYIETTDDNGGVHLNSGIPNRAFFLVADALGGAAWDAPGHIWYDTLTGGALPASCDFIRFATETAHVAAQRYGTDSAEHTAVLSAWASVGVS